MKKNIVLAGFMGTGKSTVGGILARRLGFRLVDMDERIEQRAGRRISEIFARDGEAEFRRMESELARELSGGEEQVIAAGGGVVLNPANVELLGRTGVVVCLTASADTILKRVEKSGHRPLLDEGGKAERIRSLLAQRRDLYAALPWQVETDALDPEAVADRVVAIYRKAST